MKDLKSINWNATDSEMELYFDMENNYGNLMNRYLAMDTVMKNKIKSSQDSKAYIRLEKCRMNKLFQTRKYENKKFVKFTEWIDADKQLLILKRDDSNSSVIARKTELVDRKDKEILDQRLVIANLQKQMAQLKIELKREKETVSLLSSKNYESIIPRYLPDPIIELINEWNKIEKTKIGKNKFQDDFYDWIEEQEEDVDIDQLCDEFNSKLV